MNGCFFTIFTIISLFVISIPMADAELSYEEQVEFTSGIKQIEGHILAAKENMLVGNNDLAKIHLSHPIAEIYQDLHSGLKHHSQIDQKLELVLFILKNTDTNVTLENFDKQTSEILKVLHESESVLIKKELTTSSAFKLDVLRNLLELSKYEYGAGIESTNNNFRFVELQDSYAFVVCAEDIIYTINDINPDKKNSLLLQLYDIKLNILNEEYLDVVQIQFDKILEDTNDLEDVDFEYEIMPSNDDLKPNPTQKNSKDDVLLEDLNIPSWIKLNADWWAHDLIPDAEFISAMEYLIKQDIIVVSFIQSQNTDHVNTEIPSWIRNNADWWADGFITDEEFISGLEYLIKHGILRI